MKNGKLPITYAVCAQIGRARTSQENAKIINTQRIYKKLEREILFFIKFVTEAILTPLALSIYNYEKLSSNL